MLTVNNPERLNDIFDNWANGWGIMAQLFETGRVPWEEEGTILPLDMPYDLDLAYHGRSGNKLLSPLVKKLYNGEGGYQYDGSETYFLVWTIVRMFAENWRKQWETLSTIYNPIENYNMEEVLRGDEKITAYGKTTNRTDNLSHGKTGTETHTPNTTETRTDNLSHAKSGTETITPNTTETRTPNISKQEVDSIYGFNSLEGVNTDKSQNTETGTETVLRTGTETKQISGSDTDTGTQSTTRTGTETTQYNTTESDTGTQATSDGGRDVETRNYTLTRKGNIGVTTTQQMITQERQLWQWNFFKEVVFPDIDSLLCLSVY